MVARRGARTVIVALLSALAAIMVVRVAFVASYGEADPQRAAQVWPGHPAVAFHAGLARIGEAAASGREVDGAIIDPVLAAARDAPLAPQPFLVRGVQLRVAGDEAGAGRAFFEAMRRDPRSIAARFFLADHYSRSGAIARGLEEVAALTRLVPGSAARIAPVLASYARAPGGAAQVKAMLGNHPELEPALLHLLAGDADNAGLILSIASDRGESEGERPSWQARLVSSLVSSGRYGDAYALWARFMDLPESTERPLLFDPKFERETAVAPFAWTLVSSAAGIVEPDGGGLHVIYYGRDNITLASQLLLLAPGSYELAMRVANAGDGASSLAWTMTCLPSKKIILTVDLARTAAARGSGQGFSVPATGCPAQRLQLAGKAPDFPQTVDLTLSGLTLTRGNRR